MLFPMREATYSQWFWKAADPLATILSKTNAAATTAGWIWDISLQCRRGVGHVFSTAHISDDDAERKLRKYVSATGGDADARESKKISITPGYRRQFWKRNCVAVGLSAGFVEPLEASALVMVELSASMIANRLPANREVMTPIAKRFNESISYKWNRIVDFLKLHDVLSRRQEAFWRDNRSPSSVPESLAENLAIWRRHSLWREEFLHRNEIFPEASYQYVLYGMGFETADQTTASANAYCRDVSVYLAEVERQRGQLSSFLPDNKTLLAQLTNLYN